MDDNTSCNLHYEPIFTGSAKGNPAVFLLMFVNVVSLVVFSLIVIAVVFILTDNTAELMNTNNMNFFLWIAFVMGCLMIPNDYRRIYKSASSTKINVFTDRIEGVAVITVLPMFFDLSPEAIPFNFTFDQIEYVKLTKMAIVIRVEGKKHYCFIKKRAEIYQSILQKIND